MSQCMLQWSVDVQKHVQRLVVLFDIIDFGYQKTYYLLQILNDLSIKQLVKLILYENDARLLKFKRSPVQVDLLYVEV